MVNEHVFVDKLRHINQYIEDLEQMRGLSKAEYVDDMVTQRAVERTLMNLIQACIDLA
ncbi:HepT-like ribonuclease domain-containing protein [Halorussus caseinilyticus]|uniref:HepT-like ribonuclease domain-containing protein n=1 Tax=Halorussus caseinilyticus TaxID=3034025 RepID=A0ABD5WFF9_9EURY